MPNSSSSSRRPRVLYVDDDAQQRALVARLVSPQLDVVVAASGVDGLQLLEGEPTFPVVVSDLDMPNMNGAQFLARVRKVAPDATRVLLTGHVDVSAAIDAVNDGQIFRFLTKPCEARQLVTAIEAAIEQNRLVTTERILLEQTLHGSIKMLTEVLALANPTAFGRASRVRNHASALAKAARLELLWPVEVAAMLSQIGCITLPPATVEKLYKGHPLSKDEQAATDRLPAIADALLANIPRLEAIRACLLHQGANFADAGREGLPVGARVLKIVLDFDILEARGNTEGVALDTMRGRTGWYDPDLLESFALLHGCAPDPSQVREIALGAVTTGMVFVEDVRTTAGLLVVSRGYEVTEGLVERIRNFPVEGLVRVTMARTG